MTQSLAGHAWWLASRASGLVALALVTVSVVLGLTMAGKLSKKPSAGRVLSAIHEQTAVTGLVAIAVHGLTLLGDAWLNPGPAGIAVPFLMAYRPLFTGFGIIAGWLAALLGLSFYVRRRIGPRLWRQAHKATIFVYILGVAHTLGAGTDAAAPGSIGRSPSAPRSSASSSLPGWSMASARAGRRRSEPDPRCPWPGGDRPSRRSGRSRDRADRSAGILVVGAASLQRCVETLRSRGYDGGIRIVCGEPELPYDRPPLSKGLLAGDLHDRDVAFRDRDWYEDQCVELILDRRATKLEAKKHTVELGDCTTLRYEKLLIATGSAARRLPALQGYSNVHYLRTIEDARRLRDEVSRGARLVIVGAGFIGQEVAATARQAGAEVKIVEALAAPLAGVLGEDVGRRLMRMHDEEGVEVRLSTMLEGARGNGAVEELILTGGERLECDAVVVGVGVSPVRRVAPGQRPRDRRSAH